MRLSPWILLLVACTGTAVDVDPDTGESDSDTETDGVVAVPTWTEDVQPLYARHCNRCHAGEGSASFDMRSYDAARTWAAAAQRAVSERRMPPWGVDNEGDCGDWQPDNWLSDADRALLDAWYTGGTPRGPDLPETPIAPRPSLVASRVLALSDPLDLRQVLTRDEQYWCVPYEVPDGFGYATGFEVVPSHPALLHHVTLNLFDPAAAVPTDDGDRPLGDVVRALDAESTVPGFPCDAPELDRRGPSEMLFSWAAGSGAITFPQGTGVLVPDDILFVVEHHFAGPPVAASDTTVVRLAHQPQVERPGHIWLVPGFQFLDAQTPGGVTLPPGEAAYDLTYERDMRSLSAVLSPVSERFVVEGVMPHMHGMGRAQQVWIGDAEDPACFARVDPFSDDWQFMYWRQEPLRASLDDTLRFMCTFDTREATEPVHTSFSTTDEMCMVQLYLVEE